jgi:hypothetical protein
VARQRRGDIALDRLDVGVGMGARQAEEHRRHLPQGPAAQFQRLDGVGEALPCPAVRHHLDLAALFAHRLIKGRAEMLRFDTVEGRRLEGCLPGCQKRIRHIFTRLLISDGQMPYSTPGLSLPGLSRQSRITVSAGLAPAVVMDARNGRGHDSEGAGREKGMFA